MRFSIFLKTELGTSLFKKIWNLWIYIFFLLPRLLLCGSRVRSPEVSLPWRVLLTWVVIFLRGVMILLVIFLGRAGSRRVIFGSCGWRGLVRISCSFLAVCCEYKKQIYIKLYNKILFNYVKAFFKVLSYKKKLKKSFWYLIVCFNLFYTNFRDSVIDFICHKSLWWCTVL